MSIRTLTSETLKVQATPAKTPPPAQAWKTIPHISQLHPKGADQNYKNGAYNCAPAVVAMLARGAGAPNSVSDATLISTLGMGIVGPQGTDAEGIAKMLGRINMPLGGKVMAGNYSDATLKDSLAKGNKLIAQVALTGSDKQNASAHYVLITGINSQGNYIIQDPMASKASNVTPEALRKAIKDAPPDGGLIMPVAPPPPSITSSKPSGGSITSTVSGKLNTVAANTSLVSTKLPGEDVFAAKTAPKIPTPPPQPAAPAPQSSPLKVPGLLNSATLSTLSNILAGMAPPDPNAFSVDDAALAGVDTQYHPEAGLGAPRQISGREQQNLDSMNIDYGKQGTRGLGLIGLRLGLRQVTPQDKNVNEFVQELRQRAHDQDPTVARILERLEGSRNATDKQVLKLFNELELRDPGIGKKTSIDSF